MFLPTRAKSEVKQEAALQKWKLCILNAYKKITGQWFLLHPTFVDRALTGNALRSSSLTIWCHDLLFCRILGSTTYRSRTIVFAMLLVSNSRSDASGLLLLDLFFISRAQHMKRHRHSYQNIKNDCVLSRPFLLLVLYMRKIEIRRKSQKYQNERTELKDDQNIIAACLEVKHLDN